MTFVKEQCKRCVPKIRLWQVCQGSWKSETLSYNEGESLGGDPLQSNSISQKMAIHLYCCVRISSWETT